MTEPNRPTPRHPLAGLLVAQFLGAFNDNAFKMVVLLLALAQVAPGDEAADQYETTLAFVVFTLPLMLGSLPAMALGDRFGKRDLIVWTKALEVVLMLLGTVALWASPVGPTKVTLKSDGVGRSCGRWPVAAGERCARAAGTRWNGAGDRCRRAVAAGWTGSRVGGTMSAMGPGWSGTCA
jgi:MFS family permease